MLGSQSQNCVSRQEVQSILRHAHKLLSAHESSFLQSVRSLRKKLSLLQNNTVKHSSNTSTGKNGTPMCLPPKPPTNGRMLGQVFRVGHEVHFLCNPGFQLSGPETRECLDSLSWSGEEPTCKMVDAGRFKNKTSSVPTSTSSSPSVSAYMRPAHCIEFQGSMQCTCEQGYSISSQERGLCTDIDECKLFRMTQPGRLCLHMCINTAGSYYCQCPTGYSISKDKRSCQDIDECERRAHNCTNKQVCVNTFGGHRCMVVECPRFRNASYIKTSPLQCERNPCVQGEQSLSPGSRLHQLPLCVSGVEYEYSSRSVPGFSGPCVGRLPALWTAGKSGGRAFRPFSSSRQSGELLLVDPVQGPATLEVEVELSELEGRTLLGRYVTKVTLFVSPYSF